MKSNGYAFGIIRCYESIGQPDSNWWERESVVSVVVVVVVVVPHTNLLYVCLFKRDERLEDYRRAFILCWGSLLQSSLGTPT